MLYCQNENAMFPPPIAIAGESGESEEEGSSAPSCVIGEPASHSFLPDFLVNKNQGHCNKRSKHDKLTLKLSIKTVEAYAHSANKLSTV